MAGQRTAEAAPREDQPRLRAGGRAQPRSRRSGLRTIPMMRVGRAALRPLPVLVWVAAFLPPLLAAAAAWAQSPASGVSSPAAEPPAGKAGELHMQAEAALARGDRDGAVSLL